MPVTHITKGPGQKWNEGQGHSDQQQGIHHLFVAGMNRSEIEKKGTLSFKLQRYFLIFPLCYIQYLIGFYQLKIINYTKFYSAF